jgi:hypothetical protein
MMLNTVLRAAVAALLAFASHCALAQGTTLLTVTGPDGTSVDYDLATLEALPSTTLRTHTSWTDGPQQFTGVRASLLLPPLDDQGTTVQALALNDYEGTLAIEELQQYPVIIAYKRNGAYMSTREKGPLWIIFPQDEFPQLKTTEVDHKMVWHLRRLIIE